MFTLRITVGMHILELGSVNCLNCVGRLEFMVQKRTILKRAYRNSPGGILRTPFVYILKINFI